MGKAAVAIDLTVEERRELESLAGRRRTAQGLARRARIVLLAAEGLENKEICAALDVDANTVGKWRRRYAERRTDGLFDEPRPRRPREIGDDEIGETIRLTLETTPRGATHFHFTVRGPRRMRGANVTKTSLARQLRKNSTRAERKLWRYLPSRSLAGAGNTPRRSEAEPR